MDKFQGGAELLAKLLDGGEKIKNDNLMIISQINLTISYQRIQAFTLDFIIFTYDGDNHYYVFASDNSSAISPFEASRNYKHNLLQTNLASSNLLK